jgi:hypothetical protein
VARSVQLSVDHKVVRVHAARHAPVKEHGAFAMPKGKPRKPKPWPRVRCVGQVPSVVGVPGLDRHVCLACMWLYESLLVDFDELTI